MKDLIHSAIRKVTLELIYDAVDERTQEIKDRLDRFENDIRDLRGEMNRRFEAMDQKFTAMDQKFAALNARLDALHSEMNNRSGEINARFDQLFSLIVTQRKESK